MAHLFIMCEFTQQIWDDFAQGFGVQILVYSSLKCRILEWDPIVGRMRWLSGFGRNRLEQSGDQFGYTGTR